jgi:hypothetical protein
MTAFIPTNSNEYFAISLATVASELPNWRAYIPCDKSHVITFT